MLGLNYRKIESNSVGYKTDYEMFSLDFEEFLWAGGYDDAFIDDMLTHMCTLTPFNELEMSVCGELFLNYCILGGMPRCCPRVHERARLKAHSKPSVSSSRTTRRTSANTRTAWTRPAF